ncbi:hypothetical protein ACWEJS_15145, partial [Rhodococcus triatomae]
MAQETHVRASASNDLATNALGLSVDPPIADDAGTGHRCGKPLVVAFGIDSPADRAPPRSSPLSSVGHPLALPIRATLPTSGHGSGPAGQTPAAP